MVLSHLFLLLLSLSFVLSADTSCKHTFSDTGHTYDLSGAYSAVQGQDQKSPADNTNYQYYYISPCHDTTICGTSSPSPVCQQDGAGSLHSCGTLSSGVWAETGNGAGVTISYSGGEKSRASIIYYTCDKSTNGKFTQSPVDDQTKTYRIYYSTKFACPSSGGGGGDSGGGSGGGLSGGGIFMILVLVLVIVYFVGGFVFLKFYKKNEGKENVIPNYAFWVDLPSLIKEGAVYSFGKVRALVSGGQGYGEV
eukprot:TRINITY_DN970_c0_g1_i1.p1 TRINITY_DN970_c0_g1~~TRINITY_DN970_c0_g1_i1.p1  ORF type:complete len:251 (+),score=54.62 TRINITY_DN970_c0_g1_i1:114-866(+)